MLNKLRVSAYVKHVLEVRKRYCLSKQGYITSLWKRPNVLWNRKDVKKNLENFVDRMDEGLVSDPGKTYLEKLEQTKPP